MGYLTVFSHLLNELRPPYSFCCTNRHSSVACMSLPYRISAAANIVLHSARNRRIPSSPQMARVDIFLPEKLQAQMQSRRRTSDSWQYSCNLVPKNAFEKMGELFGRFALLATCSYDCAYWVTGWCCAKMVADSPHTFPYKLRVGGSVDGSASARISLDFARVLPSRRRAVGHVWARNRPVRGRLPAFWPRIALLGPNPAETGPTPARSAEKPLPGRNWVYKGT